MILFIGEIKKQTQFHQEFELEKPTMPIKNGNWANLSTPSSRIFYNDFSKTKDCSQSGEGGICLIAGQPVLARLGKIEQMELIAKHLRNSDFHILEEANGVFCGLVTDAESNRVHLFTDYLGLRKIYLISTAESIIFSSALWLIEETFSHHLSPDKMGLVETGTLGYALGNKTIYQEVTLLPSGSVLTIGADGKNTITKYFDLTLTPKTKMQQEDAILELMNIWNSAVQDRHTAKTKAFSFLSGGMDSRLLVHSLTEICASVHTANFAPFNSRDRVLGKEAANAMGTIHYEHPDGSLPKNILAICVSDWEAAQNSDSFHNSPYLWSGDGGSVGLGHVYLSDELTTLANDRNFAEFSIQWCKFNKKEVPHEIYQDKKVGERLLREIAELTQSYSSSGNKTSAYYFLMFNDQRRHLDTHYETYHRHGFDFNLPFFDKRLITLTSSFPCEWLNNHRMYTDIYLKKGGNLTSTPWQTYPRHIPCPLTIDSKLIYQWGKDSTSERSQRTEARKCGIAILRALIKRDFPRNVFKSPALFLGALLTLVGAADKSYYYAHLKHSIRQP